MRKLIFLTLLLSFALGLFSKIVAQTVSIRDTSLIEGNGTDLPDTLNFVVERTDATTSFWVNYITLDSTAFYSENDYGRVTGRLFFAESGPLTDTIKVPVFADDKTELDELLKVEISCIFSESGPTVMGDSVALGTIINNDTSYVVVRDTALIEGDTGTDSLRFVVDLDGELDIPFNYILTSFDSTATSPSDFQGVLNEPRTGSGSGVGTFFEGVDTITIAVFGDTKTELDEYLNVSLRNLEAGGRSLFFRDSTARGTIFNNDSTAISIADASIIEGDAGTDTIEFVISLDKMVDSLGISYRTIDSTALLADMDYVAQEDTIYMNCVLTDTIKIAVNGNTVVELDEYFKIDLREIISPNRKVVFADSIGIGTIINNDTARFTIDDVILDEGDTSQTIFTFTITLDNELDRAITIDYATCDSTATIANNDYVANAGTLNFAGQLNEKDTVQVIVIGDGIVEIDEIFTVKLNNIVAGGLAVFFADSIGAGSIQNDDFDPSIADPCDCLKNESNTGTKDGQFSETVTVTSQNGEVWYITSVSGLYQAPVGAFPPAKGGNPYPLVSFVTGAAGQKLTEVDLGNGLSQYIINGLHVDDIGYNITVSNGQDVLSIENLCHYEKACGADQTIVMPFFPEVSGKAQIEDCAANNRFINDGIHLYKDDVARYNDVTICPNITGQILTVAFQTFDVAAGDTLLVYDGIDSTSTLIAKGSGNSISQFNGGWVSSNCDPNVNATGCLTFAFTTNGDNNKGAGWDATINCALQGVTTLNRPDDVFASAKCDSLKTPVNLRMPIINRSSGDCVLSNDDIIVTYCDIRDTLPAGQLSFPVFPFGTYDITYQLLADTTITTSNRVLVSAPSLVCNDTIITTIGQGCVTMIEPDNLIENPCDTMGGLVSQTYTIRVKTDTGYVVGSTPNYPLLNSGKDGNITCNKFYEVTVFRTLQSNNGGCTQSTLDSCTGVVKLIDGIKPIFVEIENDTVFGCHDMNLTQDMLPQPVVIDNCELDRIEAAIPPNPTENCDVFKTIQVTWTAYDVCGNTSVATQNITIQRPETVDTPRDTTLDCGANTNPDAIGWPKIDSDGDGIGDQVITPSNNYCNFELIYEDETIPGTCGNSSNILRIFTLFDDCENVTEPIFIDTQYILLRDTIAPIVFCPTTNELGNQLNPYQFRTDYNACTGLPGTITPPTGSDDCDNQLAPIVTGIFRVADNRLMANNLAFLSPLEVGSYRVAYVLRDDCGNTSDVCNVYFNIIDQTIPTAVCTDELIVSLANGNLVITAEDISNGSFDACGLDTLLVRRTICGSSTDYPSEINEFVANKFGSEIDANGWSSAIEIGCCDVNSSIRVQLLVVDKGGNFNKCWLTISPENQPQSVCGDLPDAEGYCDDYATNYIGQSTDTNGNRAYDDDEWQPITEELLDIINRQFGNPACNAANTVCINSSIEQEYQLIRDNCGVQNMRRRFRTRNPQSSAYAWYYQNIKINYRPGWSFTFPADTTLQCGTTDVGNIPEMLLAIDRGTCDQIGWEVKDQIFETADGSCFKVLREWSVINGCQHSDVQNPFELPRDQFAGKVTANSKRTFTSNDVIAGVPLNTQGYFTYTQVIIVIDNEAPIVTIAAVDTCIVGVEDVAPFGQADVTPGAAPYECDTVRVFSATGMDCTASNQLDFSYEIFEGATRVGFGQGSSFNYVVQPNSTYTVRFTAADNCGNIGSADRSYTFRDCRRPNALCQAVALNLNNTQTAILSVNNINAYSYDNCTDTASLEKRIWHPTLGTTPPTNVTEVLALPTTVTLDCQSLGNTVANLYVVDASQNYSLCAADVTLTDNLSVCPAGPRSFIAGRIQTILGDMVEEVEVQVSGTGTMPEMITTDVSGTFRYEVATGENYTVKPKKTMNPLNGVSTFDLVLIQKHILGLQTFDSPYHYIAADINQSNTVTAYDMVILRQLILNILTDFPNNESWKFVNMAYPMDSVNPLTEGYTEEHTIENINKDVALEFMAVKIGDVNGTAKPNALVAGEDRSTNGTIVIDAIDQQVVAGQSYVVDFSVENLNQLEGYQFTLAYDGLTFENWEGGLIDENYFGYTLAKKGFITTSWNKPNSNQVLEETSAFKLRFTAHTDGLLSEMLSISSEITAAEGYDLSGELLDIELAFDKMTIGDKVFDLYQNRPNPFKEKTEIGFYLPQASKATLTVMDVTGKVIKTIQGDYEKGEHAILLERGDFPASGLLYYQLETAAGKMTKTMLVFD